MSMTFSFDPLTLAEIAALEQFPVYVTMTTNAALFEGAKIFAQAAIDNTWAGFQNPTGKLASDIVAIMDGQGSSSVTSGAVYSMRREYGFSGMTDSLGRLYTYDPGILYMTNAFNDKTPEVEDLVKAAVEAALVMATLGGGG